MTQTLYYPVETKSLKEFERLQPVWLGYDDFEPRLIELGFAGWDLVAIVNGNTFLFNKIDAPLNYQIVKTDEYMNDFETSANTLGLSGWIFVDIYNSYAIFKKFAIS